MAIGKTEMYIITMYRTGIAGCRPESGTLENPAVRVEADWKRPLTIRTPVGRSATTAALIYSDISFENLSLEPKVLTHVEDNEADQVHNIEYDQNPEKPPGWAGREQQCETPTGMV